MKKITLLLISLLMLSTLVTAQKKLCIHKISGDKIEFVASDVAYIDFEDEVPSIDANGHEYVDLGLPSGTLWATMNVGADSPEDYGDYFAWGETTTKLIFSSANYTNVSNISPLPLKNDVANVILGGDWRMPTKEEQDELRTKCTWTWTTQNGANGYIVTGPSGKSIFLPAAGFRANSDLKNVGSWGCYWSSTLYQDRVGNAFILAFLSNNVAWSATDCFGGLTVRPVLKAK